MSCVPHPARTLIDVLSKLCRREECQRRQGAWAEGAAKAAAPEPAGQVRIRRPVAGQSLPKAFAPGCQHSSFGSFMPQNSHRCPVMWDLSGFIQRWLFSNE
eukprot:scaffold34617_cov16-Prasinocladus_malaysianus.AAC.1